MKYKKLIIGTWLFINAIAAYMVGFIQGLPTPLQELEVRHIKSGAWLIAVLFAIVNITPQIMEMLNDKKGIKYETTSE